MVPQTEEKQTSEDFFSHLGRGEKDKKAQLKCIQYTHVTNKLSL